MISALNKREKSPNIFHSDQGSEYRSNDLAEILRAKNIQSSMSSKGSPWQNGRQKSFYQKFKLELGHPNIYETKSEPIEAIALQIHYYNHRRIHSVLKMPPTIFYQRFKAEENLKNFATPKNEPLHPYLQIWVQNKQISPQTNSSINRLEVLKLSIATPSI